MFWVEQEEILPLQIFFLQALQTVTIKAVALLATNQFLLITIRMFQWFNNGIKHQINLQQHKVLSRTARAFSDHLLQKTHLSIMLGCLIDPRYLTR